MSGSSAVRKSITLRAAAVGGLIAVKLAIVLFLVPGASFVNEGHYNVNNLPDNYPEIAINWMQGNGYRVRPDTAETMIRPPVNILLLAGLFAIFGKSLTAVQVTNVLLVVAGGWLLMRLMRTHLHDSTAAWFAAAAFVLHPGIMLAETRAGVEVLITFLMILFAYVLDAAFASKRALDFLLAGLVLGITTLTKSTPAIVAPFLLVYAYLRGGEQRAVLCRNVVVLWIGFGVVLAPWVVRNYLISGHIVPSMTIKGAAAYQGLFLSRGGQGDLEFYEALGKASEEQKTIAGEQGYSFWHGDMLPIFYSSKDEVEFDNRLYQYVIEEYKRTPALFLDNVCQNMWRFWLQGKTRAATTINAFFTVPLLGIALAGVCLNFRRRLGFDLIVLLATAYYAAHLPLIAFAKYHVPLIPFLALFAGVAIRGLLRSASATWDGALPASGDA